MYRGRALALARTGSTALLGGRSASAPSVRHLWLLEDGGGSRLPVRSHPRHVWNAFDRLEAQLQRMEAEFDRAVQGATGMFPSAGDWGWGTGGEWRPMHVGDGSHPASVESYRLRNPIVEEDGVKKMKLAFDVRRFKPEEVSVKTSAKDNSLTIEAKHESDNAKFEFFRQFVLPDGVKANEVTCKYNADGTLMVQAPFTPPPEPEPAKDTDIDVKHE